MDKYNFVFFLDALFEYNKVIYSEIGKRQNVRSVFGFVPKNKFMRKLFQLQHSKTTNRYFSIPFKSLWFGTYFKNDFIDPQKPIVFIFDARWLEYDYMRSYAMWLRKKYPGCKIVVNYIDIVATWKDCGKPDAIRGLADMLVSYDKDDAEKYGMYYHPTVYAEANISKPNNTPTTDVFFVGAAKNRMQKILETYDRLEKAGLNCYLRNHRTIKNDVAFTTLQKTYGFHMKNASNMYNTQSAYWKSCNKEQKEKHYVYGKPSHTEKCC